MCVIKNALIEHIFLPRETQALELLVVQIPFEREFEQPKVPMPGGVMLKFGFDQYMSFHVP